MNAKDFYQKFIKATDKDRIVEEDDGRKRCLFDIYKKDAEFTPVITKILNEIIETEDGYKSQNEYFRIDAVGWKSNFKKMEADAKKKGILIQPHLWDLKIAVEHENSKSDWSDEVMKLIHVKCPLKVIISCSYNDERGEVERAKLDFVATWMQEIEALQKGTDEEYLIILGNGCNHKTGESDYSDFGYVGYLYNWSTKHFEKL